MLRRTFTQRLRPRSSFWIKYSSHRKQFILHLQGPLSVSKVQKRGSRNDRRTQVFYGNTWAVGGFPTCSLSACLRSSSLRSCSISSYLLLCSRSCCFLISRSRRCCCRWKQVSVIITYNRFIHSGHDGGQSFKSCSFVDALQLRLSEFIEFHLNALIQILNSDCSIFFRITIPI